MLGISFIGTSTLFIEARTLLNPEITDVSSLVSQFALGFPISTLGFLEIGLLPLTLDGKWFTH